MTTGNSDNTGVSLAIALQRTGIDWEHRLRATADYQRSNGRTSREQYLAAWEPRFQVSDDLFAYGLAQYESDRFQGFSSRYSLSGGLGYKAIDSSTAQLSLKAGPAWRKVDFINGTGYNSLGALAGFDFSWQFARQLRLTQNADLVADSGGTAVVTIDSDNVSVLATTGLEATISSRPHHAPVLHDRLRQQPAFRRGLDRHAIPVHTRLWLLTTPASPSPSTPRDGKARTGRIRMRRGEIRTPAFMPVGTAATVKAMKPEAVRATGADIILGNTYHLMLRPGAERVAKLGGLHKFMNWERPILTDSGGYQVDEPQRLTQADRGRSRVPQPPRRLEAHAHPRALDGNPAPTRLGHGHGVRRMPAHRPFARRDRGIDGDVDALGEAQPRWRSTPAASTRRTPRCSASSRARSTRSLRRKSAQALSAIGFDGYAIGGLAVGEGQEAMFATLDFAPDQLPEDAPRYLMGVGKPDDLVGAVERGVDMFDCVLPTRSGRNGQAFTWSRPAQPPKRAPRRGHRAARRTVHAARPARSYSRAYLHHLQKAGEILGAMLVTEHNLSFYQQLMQAMRAAIGEGALPPSRPISVETISPEGLSPPLRPVGTARGFLDGTQFSMKLKAILAASAARFRYEHRRRGGRGNRREPRGQVRRARDDPRHQPFARRQAGRDRRSAA